MIGQPLLVARKMRKVSQAELETIANMNPGPKQRSYPLPSTLRDQNRTIPESVIRHGRRPAAWSAPGAGP